MASTGSRFIKAEAHSTRRYVRQCPMKRLKSWMVQQPWLVGEPIGGQGTVQRVFHQDSKSVPDGHRGAQKHQERFCVCRGGAEEEVQRPFTHRCGRRAIQGTWKVADQLVAQDKQVVGCGEL